MPLKKSGQMKHDIENLRKFLVPEVVFGVGARFLALQYIKNLGGRKVLMVTDPGVVEAGWAQRG